MKASSIDNPISSVEHEGAQRFRAAAAGVLEDLTACVPELPKGSPGRRITGASALRPTLAADGPIGCVAASVLGPRARPVRAVVFDKRPGANWFLGWHQDRTIAVARRFDVKGFGPWTVKQGIPHVAPPFDLLESMVTLRVHLDDVPPLNAPLLIAPGSHRLGSIAIQDIADAVRRCGTLTCVADAGDIWLYSTPILHASEPAAHPARRRVLQIDYAACELPGELEWLGV